jgi:hypothetical protein
MAHKKTAWLGIAEKSSNPRLSAGLDCSASRDRALRAKSAPGRRSRRSAWSSSNGKETALLAIRQLGQKNDLAIWKFQRIVMGSRIVLKDLSKDCGLVVDNVLSPRPRSYTSNFLCERQLGAGQYANCNVHVFRRGKSTCPCQIPSDRGNVTALVRVLDHLPGELLEHCKIWSLTKSQFLGFLAALSVR